MFDRPERCKRSHGMMIRLNNYLYVFNLRQGTILIAVHHIALSMFLWVILVVGMVHVGFMCKMIREDMQDDVERRGLFEVTYGEQVAFHEGGAISTNNQRRFEKALDLANATGAFLYTSSILTALYLACCHALLFGAISYKRECVLLWIMAACVALLLFVAAMVVGDGQAWVVDLFGGHNLYRLCCALFVLTYLYAICTVGSFAQELRARRPAERGERLLLLDHAAHSSLLSAAQLNKLAHGTRTHFV